VKPAATHLRGAWLCTANNEQCAAGSSVCKKPGKLTFRIDFILQATVGSAGHLRVIGGPDTWQIEGNRPVLARSPIVNIAVAT
jgi:hypothetical protein